MLTFPAFSKLLVSLSMMTLLRLRSPLLMMETRPDLPWVPPTSTISVLYSSIFILACLLVMIDKSLSSRFPCGLLSIVTSPEFPWEDSVSISALVRLLVVMLTSPPFPESFSPTENVLIDSCCMSPSSGFSGGLNFIVSAIRDITPPFPELPESGLEKELKNSVLMSPL